MTLNPCTYCQGPNTRTVNPGLCNPCRLRARRNNGDPSRKTAPNGAPDAFCVRVAETPATDKCVPWPYGTGSDGRGMMSYGRYATHVVLELDGRPRPPAPGDHALHSCDNPICVNPAHLEWGTHRENMRQMTTRDRGAAHLTNAEVEEIRSAWEPNTRGLAQSLADHYGVSKDTVRHIGVRRGRKHV